MNKSLELLISIFILVIYLCGLAIYIFSIPIEITAGSPIGVKSPSHIVIFWNIYNYLSKGDVKAINNISEIAKTFHIELKVIVTDEMNRTRNLILIPYLNPSKDRNTEMINLEIPFLINNKYYHGVLKCYIEEVSQ